MGGEEKRQEKKNGVSEKGREELEYVGKKTKIKEIPEGREEGIITV